MSEKPKKIELVDRGRDSDLNLGHPPAAPDIKGHAGADTSAPPPAKPPKVSADSGQVAQPPPSKSED